MEQLALLGLGNALVYGLASSVPKKFLGRAAGGHTFINNRIVNLALERNMEMSNFHAFAPFLGAERDHVLYKKRLPGGPTGLIEA